MKTWEVPQTWSEEDRQAHLKGLEFLQSISGASPRIVLSYLANGLPSTLIQGNSRRWYSIETGINPTQFGNRQNHWQFIIRAAAQKKDLLLRNKYSVFLCLHPSHVRGCLPLGDQLAALSMALAADKMTAVRIPLVAQFIVAPRTCLLDIYQFCDEGVLYTDEFAEEENVPYEPPEEVGGQDWDFMNQEWVDEENEAIETAVEAEFETLQQWMDSHEDSLAEQDITPWPQHKDAVDKLEDEFYRMLD